jgi:hypothetical protein
MADKWLAILPFALDALYRFSEPKEGWDGVRRKGKDLEHRVEE